MILSQLVGYFCLGIVIGLLIVAFILPQPQDHTRAYNWTYEQKCVEIRDNDKTDQIATGVYCKVEVEKK